MNNHVRNILIISASPNVAAGNVAYEFQHIFLHHNYDARLLTHAVKESPTHNIIPVFHKNPKKMYFFRVLYRLKMLFKGIVTKPRTNAKYYFYDIYERITFHSTRKILKKSAFKPDAIVLLFTQNLVNAKNIYQMNTITGAPVFWIMMDMAPITGGCHYAWDCKGYTKECGTCPGLHSSSQWDISHKNFLFKKKYINKTNIHLIAASEWQYRQAKSGILFAGKPVHKILLPVNEDLFKPVDREMARTALGLPKEKRIIFFGSMSIEEERKGLQYLLDALNIIHVKEKSSNIHILITGKADQKPGVELPFEYTYIEYLSQEDLPKAYQASDVFACPSIEDSGPMMINQSLMCGTPVVAFEMGVAPDLVHTGKTGYRAKHKDSTDFANGLMYILTMELQNYIEMRDHCRKSAYEKCSTKNVMSKFSALFDKINA